MREMIVDSDFFQTNGEMRTSFNARSSYSFATEVDQTLWNLQHASNENGNVDYSSFKQATADYSLGRIR